MERMTLRHKNTGKWAKRMRLRWETLDDGTKQAMQDQLQIGNEMRQKHTDAEAIVKKKNQKSKKKKKSK